MSDLASGLCAGACCLTMYGGMAAGAGWLASWRTKKVEAELGRPALPQNETAMLLYAGASALWLSAAVLALVGMARREWTRAGRNCFFILLGHFGLVTAMASLMPLSSSGGPPGPLPFVIGTCAVILFSFVGASAFLWRWGSLRVARIEKEPPTGDPPGAERWAVYVGSILVGMLGLIAAIIYKEPQNVRVGVTALRISLMYLMVVVVAVCVGLPVAILLLG
ncbi:MAG: hypothetical protein H6719_28110 [Sandaracinaceae bacterium]|nr:hypothetical protein [Sandaracinaceae bacterium]